MQAGNHANEGQVLKGTGQIRKWIANKGYGFITPDSKDQDVIGIIGSSLFFHVSALVMDRAFEVSDFEGYFVEFEAKETIRNGKKQWKAISVAGAYGKYINHKQTTANRKKVNANLYVDDDDYKGDAEDLSLTIDKIEKSIIKYQQGWAKPGLYTPMIHKRRLFRQESDQKGTIRVTTQNVFVKQLKQDLARFVGLDLDLLPIDIRTNVNDNRFGIEDEKVCKGFLYI